MHHPKDRLSEPIFSSERIKIKPQGLPGAAANPGEAGKTSEAGEAGKTDFVGWFVEKEHVLACLSVSGGDAHHAVHFGMGRIRERGVCGEDAPLTEESLFDLASLTKLFTALTVFRLREEGLLDLSRPVTAYAPRFRWLKDVSVDTVLGFGIGLETPGRVDAQPTREAGLDKLFRAAPRPLTGTRFYSDIHAMVLKYVIEGVSGERFWDCLRRRILEPLRMRDTWAHVPENRRGCAIACGWEHRIEGEKWIRHGDLPPGVVHDPKARLLSPAGEDLCGHAGLFSTRGDMVRFCQGILQGKIVSGESLRLLARNRTGRRLPGGGYTQYLGCQCYVKHPRQYDSEIPAYMGRQAFGLSGFTGQHLTVDPERGLFSLFLGNRVLNRLTVCHPPPGKTLTDYGLHPEGYGAVTWPDGSRVFSSVHYVHQRDARLHAPLARLLGVREEVRS